MKINYDSEVDALYIQLSNRKPDGAIELIEGVNMDTTNNNKIVGIEILNASKKIDIKTILTYTLARQAAAKVGSGIGNWEFG